MVDPTSDLGEDSEESAPTCATCGENIVNETHRVLTTVEDGRVNTRHFCDEACLSALAE